METTGWRQFNLEFSGQHDPESVFAKSIARDLEAARRAGIIGEWWFIRKQPWRLRIRGRQPFDGLAVLLDRLTVNAELNSWAEEVYEPEVFAFGGPAAMEAAHHLFHLDSRHIMDRAAALGAAGRGRREITVILAHALMRGAGLDWYEQGDVWARFAEERVIAGPAQRDLQKRADLMVTMRRLMLADPHALTKPGQLLDGYTEWISAFERTGQTLVDLARRGHLKRGLRDVLAHHLVFHANRAGLPVAHQSVMACVALNIVFALPGDIAHQPATDKDERVTDHDLSADDQRNALTQVLVDEGAIKSPSVEDAFRRLPRHLFLPGVDLKEAYGNVTVYTKTEASGARISAASQPSIVALQLEQLGLRPGEVVYEAGAGTGINAGYMALMVGPEGKVYTTDFDSDIVDGARKGLANAGIDNVEVILGDGALGLPEAAPFNKVIATVGAFEIPSTWLDQLAPGGRIVVPVRLRGTAQRSIAFERARDRWVSLGSELCVFMPLRGIGDDARRHITLAEGITLQVHPDQQADPESLAAVLDRDRHEEWTGVVFAPRTSFEWMELWLGCTMPNAMMRMNVDNEMSCASKVSPMFPWGAMATVQGSNIAYLTLRKLESPDGNTYEVGVISHGTDAVELANDLTRQIKVWDNNFRTRNVRFEMPDVAETTDASIGKFVLDRPSHPITVIWE